MSKFSRALFLLFAALSLNVPASASTYNDLTERSYRARELWEAQPKNADAAYNFAIYQMQIGDQQYAQTVLKQAVALKPDDWIIHLGLAQTLANDPKLSAEAALPDLAVAESQAISPEKFKGFANLSRPEQKELLQRFDSIGRTYLTIDKPALAVRLYLRALALGADEKMETMLVRAALAANDISLAAAHLNSHLKSRLNSHNYKQEFDDRELLLAAVAHFKSLVTTAPALGPMLESTVSQAERHFASDGELFYQLGRSFAAAGRAAMALRCYKQAWTIDATEGKYAIAYSATLAEAGHTKEALAVLKAIMQVSSKQEPSLRRTLVSGLYAPGLDWLSKRPRHGLKTSIMTFTKLSCNCKISAFNYSLRRLPGVVFAQIPEGKGPQNLLIYDPSITTAQAVWSKMGKDASFKILPESQTVRGSNTAGTITDFVSLYKIASANYETAVVFPRKYYSFEPLPLKTIEK